MKPDGKTGTAGKGPLIQKELSATLGVTQDQYLFAPKTRGGCYSLDDRKMGSTYIWEEQANTLSATDYKGPQVVTVKKNGQI